MARKEGFLISPEGESFALTWNLWTAESVERSSQAPGSAEAYPKQHRCWRCWSGSLHQETRWTVDGPSTKGTSAISACGALPLPQKRAVRPTAHPYPSRETPRRHFWSPHPEFVGSGERQGVAA